MSLCYFSFGTGGAAATVFKVFKFPFAGCILMKIVFVDQSSISVV